VARSVERSAGLAFAADAGVVRPNGVLVRIAAAVAG